MFLLALSTATMASSIVINEVELNPSQGGADWVELFNSGNESVDISGWTATITDGSWVGNFSPVPNGTIIEAGGFFVFNGLTSWNHDNGGYATLYTASKEKVDETPVRQDLMDNDFTYGRHPDGHDTNTDGDWGLGYATKGRTNNR
jgi:hypothetical protein